MNAWYFSISIFTKFYIESLNKFHLNFIYLINTGFYFTQ